MQPALINSLVEQLLARDGEYKPLELLLLLRRLDRAGLSRFESKADGVLEDELYGNIEAVGEQLNWAANRARELGLLATTDPRSKAHGALFRRATTDHVARTRWLRVDDQAQADLFLDNRLATARAQLIRALESADAPAAEKALNELSAADPANELQADAEHLVGALGWLGELKPDPARVLEAIEGDLDQRARRLLGPSSAGEFQRRFYLRLADMTGALSPSDLSPELAPALLRLKAEDWEGALEALDAQDAEGLDSSLRLVEIRASFKLDQRERALRALCRLCWDDPAAAENWLELDEDDELARRVEQFWDLEEPLAMPLFPSWLLARGYPIPVVEAAPETEAARALDCIRRLRTDPSDLEARQWLQDHSPELMAHWMGQRPG
ncbi:MAG: hypothetical protein AAGJ52_02545 [Pseudomonadota bacterium]